jgi:hypothetical protein
MDRRIANLKLQISNCKLKQVGTALILAALTVSSARAYVEVPYSLGRLVQESTHIMLLRVEKVDKERNMIIYRKVQDLKGAHPTDVVKHNIGRGGFHPREWQTIMNWAQPGQTGVFFHNGGASETCIANYWYQAYAGGEWWNMSHGEPYLLRTYAGKPEKLASAVTALLGGQEVAIPCMVDGDKNALALGQAKVQRLKASLKLQDYNAQRDFVGWGAEDFRSIAGMPGFSHLAQVPRVDPRAGAVVPADFDGDGLIDFCLVGEGKTVLLSNGGTSLNEVAIPYSGPSRAADWADYNADGKPDLLLATPAGPKLLTNQGDGTFKDHTGGLPHEPYWNVTAAAWIDADADNRPDILLANGFLGLRLYRNLASDAPKPRPPAIGRWHVCGPFANDGQRGFETVYPPESQVDLNAKYTGKGGIEVGWRAGDFTDGQVNSLKVFADNDNCVAYLYRELDFGGAIELPVSLGSDDTLTVWLNGQKLLAENVYRAAGPDQNRLVLKLQPGNNALLIKICQGNGDFAFYFKADAPTEAVPPLFVDLSSALGLGPGGVAGSLRGDHLAVADLDGDHRSDFLYSAAEGVVVRNTPQGFVELKEAGIRYRAGRIAPTFGDYDGDGRVDLFVPQAEGCRLFKNSGQERFTEVTAAVGLQVASLRNAVSACWADVAGRGRPDLLIACVRGPNRYLRHLPDGKFVDAGRELGLYQRVFNSRGVCAVDLNKDGVLDVVFNNEGQDSTVLLGSKSRVAARSADGSVFARE